MANTTALDGQDQPNTPAYAGMHLDSLRLKNFRSCLNTVVKFRPALTLIVGENNSGKSNVIEALRLATGPLSGKRYRYFEPDDLSDDADDQPIEIYTQFSGLTRPQRGRFLTALDTETANAHYLVRHVPDETITPRLRTTYLAGPQHGPDPEPENRARINHVYLPPLRDAQKALDSASGSRLVEIIRHLTTKEQQEDFLKAANAGLGEVASHPVVTDTAKKLQDHLGRLTDSVRGQDLGLSFEAFKLHRLVRSLRIKMAEKGIDPADLAQSGLGYANLLYIASVILELQNAPDAELTLFLVEEPEAHLHPQLQAVLLDYLREQAQLSVHDDSSRPVGRIQIIATTHSPNLASNVGIANVVALRRRLTTSEGKLANDGTVAIALSDIPLKEHERRKIDQYLDVTRSELLFGRTAILVEGIAEAILLPVLARKSVFDLTDSTGLDRYRMFKAASLINIGSVDFTPYIKLLSQEVNGARLADRLVVITDGDPALKEQDAEAADTGNGDGLNSNAKNDSYESKTYNREDALLTLIDELGVGAHVHVYASRFTLEADLLEPVASNGEAMRAAFVRQKPKSGNRFDEWAAAEKPAESFYAQLCQKKKYLAKGEFAHDLALTISDSTGFACPDYLSRAIHQIST